MKKYIQNIWVRLLACLICTVSVLGVVFGAAGTLFFSQYPDKNEVQENGNKKLMENYALYVMDLYQFPGGSQLLDEVNMYMTIEKLQYNSETDVEPTITQEFSNMPEGMEPSYSIREFYGSSSRNYSTESLLQALNSSYVVQPSDHMLSVPIEGYAFDTNKGLFYYYTSRGYFKADYIDVSQDGVYYDYRLTVRNGKEIYYNSYYDRILDTSEYMSWDWVKMSVKKMGITSEYYGAMIQLIHDSSLIENNLGTMNYYVDYYHVFYVSDMVSRYNVSMAMAEPMVHQDLFMEYAYWVDLVYSFQESVSWIMVFSVLGLILGLVLLATSAPETEERLRFFHKIPVMIYTALTLVVEVSLGAITVFFALWTLSRNNGNVTVQGLIVPVALMAAIITFLLFVYVATIITRIKTKNFYRYSEFYYIVRPITFVVRTIKENLSLFWRGIGILCVISVVEYLLLCINIYQADNLMVLFVIGKVIEIPIIIYVLIQAKKLKDGAKSVAEGDLSQSINTENMFGAFKDHAEDINRVSDGIAIAVEEQMKSERFKTELITNVSHDIKTPLTSIINYVDLIKKEEITDATMLEYVDVLDRQSARLKKLIEDLMEASKASTGNLEVNLEECDMGVLLTQVVGEFEDKLSASGLEAVVTKPEEPVFIMADGRHIWRVLDNLMNNVCKYSQENTRVYVSLKQVGNEAHIEFKNISKNALNIPSDQLMQRFVRGDSSRHTEGSGLGLAIAQSLTELMNGTLKLDIDGDLFKVTLKFHLTA